MYFYAGGLERREHEDNAHTVSEEGFVDYLIGSCAGIKVRFSREIGY